MGHEWRAAESIAVGSGVDEDDDKGGVEAIVQKVVQVIDQEIHTEGGYNPRDMKGGE